MESLQAMKLGKLNDIMNSQSSSLSSSPSSYKPTQQMPIPIKDSASISTSSTKKRKTSKLVEKAFANLFVNDTPRRRANSNSNAKQKKKRQSFEMNEIKNSKTSNVNESVKRLSEIPLQFEDYAGRFDDNTVNEIQNHNEQQIEILPENVECPCFNQHPGKEQLNLVLSNLDLHQVFEAFFSQSQFLAENWKIRKLFDIKLNEWDGNDRLLEYSIDLGAFKPKNTEYQKILTNKPNECIVVESTVKAQNVLYCDYFSVVNRYCITRHESNSSRLIISNHILYHKTPNFIAKGFIERNCNSTLKEYYEYITTNLPVYDAAPARFNSNFNKTTKNCSRSPQTKVKKTRPAVITQSSIVKDSNIGINNVISTPSVYKLDSSTSKQTYCIKNYNLNLNMKYQVIFFILFFLPVQQKSSLDMKNLIEISLERVKKIENKFIKYENVFEN